MLCFPIHRTDQLDLYMDESPLLEYALSRYDDNCSIKYASNHFGENSYAFGLPKGSWLKVGMTHNHFRSGEKVQGM